MGFTLVEMLAVITIIALLVGIVGGVGVTVISGRKVSATKNVLTTLDRALEEYISFARVPPRYDWRDYENVPGPDVQPGFGEDGVQFFPTFAGAVHVSRPDASVFIRQASPTGQVASIIGAMGESFLRPTIGPDLSPGSVGADPTPSVVDAWAEDEWRNHYDSTETTKRWYPLNQRLIYYVHPANEFAQAAYGRCVAGRPYFFSAGPDGLYGLRSDIVNKAPGTNPSTDEVRAGLTDNIYSYPVGPADLASDGIRQ